MNKFSLQILNTLMILCLFALFFVTGCGGDNPITSYKRVTVEVEGAGRVTPGTTDVAFGNQLTLQAIPYSGAKFDHWDGDLTGTTNPITIKVSADMTVKAVFVSGSTHRVPEAYNLTVSTPKNTPVTFPLVGYSPDQATLEYHPEIPSHGNISIQKPANVTYIPDGAYLGPDSFNYKVSDPYNSSLSAKVNITVFNPALAGWA